MMDGKIYGLMPKVASEIGAIGKDHRNTQQNWMFRGIDDIYNALSGPLATHGVFMTSEASEINREDRKSNNDKNLIFTTVKLKVTFWAEDGSSVSTTLYGEGMDSGDKSVGKALSMALKYAAFQTFCIPVEVEEADKDHHEVGPADDRRTHANGTAKPPYKPIDPPKPAEPPDAFARFAQSLRALCDADGTESTKEQRAALAKSAAAEHGMTTRDLWQCDDDKLAAVLHTADKLRNGEPVVEMEAWIPSDTIPY